MINLGSEAQSIMESFEKVMEETKADMAEIIGKTMEARLYVPGMFEKILEISLRLAKTNQPVNGQAYKIVFQKSLLNLATEQLKLEQLSPNNRY